MRDRYVEVVQQSISYMEERLIEDISPDGIADYVGYSPFHFHRIFQSVTGISIAEYIRRRRLTHAACDLVMTDEKIITIAITYHFSSQESFTRAFKQLFQISPAKYRRFTRNFIFEKEAIPMENVMPKGWLPSGSNPFDYEMGIDVKVAHGGRASGVIRSKKDQISGFGTMMQMFKAKKYREKRMRFAAFVKSDHVEQWAGLWMRVDGEADEILAFDNMESRAIKGTTNWNQYEIVLDIPTEGSIISIGLLLCGSGTVWIDNITFEEVDDTVAVTSTNPIQDLADEPMNLQFELDFKRERSEES
ncbi:helix-turn-helix transcriptional regulator [Alkalihalobacillus sp. MEB130]|uniref:helix-turn-helix transcriptional regulator n=1 Tax=Alkalihalobacillus sp. MEB130 TaxID=2976704 RepID=UPI0028DF5BB0|nr:helix-turn-helix transcriptional regulator [Alkalihalobacillus sp. MEB130]MDT8861906.1 helix-turn-helix transcriptional regulator [Alkalihalobacillus sp. MEB130]